MAEPEAYDGGPVAALRRIAFLLERGREDTYKVKAFRGAAATILPMPADEVAGRGRGRHADRAARRSGASTGEGDRATPCAAWCPSGWPRSSAEHGGPLAAGGRELRAALRGDLHSHSDWSDGGSPIEEMAFTAIELGHDYLVLTDHSPRLTVAHGLSAERLTRQLGVVEAVNDHLGDGFTLLKGIEVDILDDGSLDQTDEMLARLDVRVASVHSKLTMDAARDDQADDRRGPQPAHQRARPLHRPAGHRQPRHPPAVAVRREGGLRGLRRARRRGRDQLPPRAAGPADEAARAGPRHSAACSRSTATRTRPGSSTSSTTAASGPRRPASTPTGSSTPGRRTACWPGRTARFRAMSAEAPRSRYAARSGAAVRSRRTATATASWC